MTGDISNLHVAYCCRQRLNLLRRVYIPIVGLNFPQNGLLQCLDALQILIIIDCFHPEGEGRCSINGSIILRSRRSIVLLHLQLFHVLVLARICRLNIDCDRLSIRIFVDTKLSSGSISPISSSSFLQRL